LFRFFSSVKLAVVLLAVLICASIAGTLYETTFDAKVARAYIYGAWWFNFWLILLCINLACAAFSRMPWKRHHTGFLLTHLGIITLLIGAMIGRRWGIEGTITLFKGQPPNNQLVVDQRVLRLEEGGQQLRPFPVSIIGRRPTAERPWKLGETPAGWTVELVDYAPLLAGDFQPQPVPAGSGGGEPAVHIRLVSKRLNQTLDNWLLAADAEHGVLDLGLASVQVRRGVAPAPDATAAAAPIPGNPAPAGDPVDESIIAFALKPGEQVAQPAPGTAPSGAQVRLAADATRQQVLISWRGATWSFDVDADRGKDQDLSGSGLLVAIENYWPDFMLKDGQPVNASADPHNPAVLLRIHGKLPVPTSDDTALPAARVPGAGDGAENQAVVYCDDRGGLTFTLKTSASSQGIHGTLKPGQPINTGWADWQLEAAQVLPRAVGQTTFRKLPEGTAPGAPAGGTMPVDPPGPAGEGGAAGMMAANNHTEGVKVRLSRDGESHEEWAAAGWTVTLPTTPQATRLAYDYEVDPLPIGLQLTNFDVEFNEGTADPASFKSTLLVTDMEGNSGTGACSMNHPFNFPGHWWNTFSGLTFKMSQASWNPDNMSQSVIQILRDPGWILKWIGSLLIVSGIFSLFYLRPSRK
jgi:hypothetical protein